MEQLVEKIKNASAVYLCGNGGSAANSLHFANDLLAVGIPAHSLVANVSSLTAIANDFGYDEVFSRQLEVMGRESDLLIVLSGSGNSANVLKAIESAKRIGMCTCAIVGGGKAGEIADIVIKTDPNMQKSEQAQLEVCHDVMLSLR